MSEQSSIPAQLRYTADHEWVQLSEADDGSTVARVGITDYAQSALGDVVFIQLPDVGTEVTAGEPVGEVESTKSVSDILAPLTGTVAARNDSVEANPELANSDPYGQGWLLELSVADPASFDTLLDATAYGELAKA